MTDVIERLRAANPVSDCSEPRFDEVRHRLTDLSPRAIPAQRVAGARQRAARRVSGRVVLAALAIGIALAVIGAATHTGGRLSLAARAYAATDSTGVIVHYVEITQVAPWRPRGEPAHGHFLVGWATRQEVWLSGSRSRVVAMFGFDINGHLHPTVREVTQNGSREELYAPGAKAILNVKRRAAGPVDAVCTSSLACDLLEAPDPVVVLRRLDAEGRLQEVGETRQHGRLLAVMVDAHDPAAIRIYLDPGTGIPVEIAQRSAGATHDSPLVLTTMIVGYERLALTAQSERLLAMRPHSDVHAICTVLIGANRRHSEHCETR
jgi:hypothetical protein